MMRARTLHPAAWLPVLVLVATVSLAHRAPGSLSTIGFNAQTGKTEIVHRLHLHDAELGVSAAIDAPSLSLGKLESRARVAIYVSERFQLRDGDKLLEPELIGAEISGDYLMVYQELPGRLEGRIELRDDILRDAFPRQVNQVNIDHSGTVRTLNFSGEDRWKAFEFDGGDRENAY